MAHEHRTALPAPDVAYDRGEAASEDRKALIWPAGRMIQGADLNEAQTLLRRRVQRVGNMVAKDGDRISGGEIVVDVDAGAVDLTAGRVYVEGDARAVAAARLTGVPMTGEVKIGVRLTRTALTATDDASLLGLHPGSDAEGEPGAAREIETIAWAREGDGGAGEFYAVYLLRDGVAIDQRPPPSLTPITQQIALYDFDLNGHYIVDGCEVSALGKIGNEQVFSIAAGTANILGFKRIRSTALRAAMAEDPDLETISAETASYSSADGDPVVVTIQRPPIAAVTQAVVTKRETVQVVRGATPNGADELPRASVVAIESVTQDPTTYVETTDYVLDGNSVSWAPGGAEPIGASTYTVTYTYNEAVTPDAITDTTITVSGGINGSTILLSYTSKVPRRDIICLNRAGEPVYVKGVSARQGALAPLPPSELLKLAEVHNTWYSATPPVIVNNGTRNFTQDEQRRLFQRLVDVLEQFDRTAAELDILGRDPVSKRGIFTDAFVDDRYRDPGEAQTAAIHSGLLMLPIERILTLTIGAAVVSMAYAEEIVLRQEQDTSSIKIQPYMSFEPMPAALKIEPPVDFFVLENTAWASPVTREFTVGWQEPPRTVVSTEVVDRLSTSPRFLREITLQFTIDGFGVGENLSALTIGNVDVTPAGPLSADGAGQIVGTFQIPAGIPSGRVVVEATGAAGSRASALYVGDGHVDTTVMRQITSVFRPAPPPPPPVQNDNGWDSSGGGGGGGETSSENTGAGDPLAQSFWLERSRFVVGVDFKIKAIGDATKPIRVQLRPIENGYPSAYEVMSEAIVDLTSVSPGDWVEARFPAPVFLTSAREFCFALLTDDLEHEVAISRLGDVIDLGGGQQARVSTQPYVVGTLFTSSNSYAWTAEQGADMAFRIVGARFTETAKTVDLWTGDFDQISDVLIRATAELATADATLRFELVRAGGEVIRLTPGQELRFDEYVTETVTIRAVLAGTELIAPVLYPGTTLIAGRLGATGTYVTRVFPLGNPADVRALFYAKVPGGASVTVALDEADDNWQAMTLDTTDIIGGGWTEPRYILDGVTAVEGRLRITLSGTPAARPALAGLRAWSK